MLSPRSPYHGKPWTPQALTFHQNLEEFAARVEVIVGLQSNGKISQSEAYEQIRQLWDQLATSREALLSDRPGGSDPPIPGGDRPPKLG
jgi:hypothetical protein